jgi:hypothetical protein
MSAIRTKLESALAAAAQGSGQHCTPNWLPIKTVEDLAHECGSKIKIIGPTGPSYSSNVIELGNGGELWLSDYSNLATVLREVGVEPEILADVKKVLERNGWTLVPEEIVLSPIREENPKQLWFFALFGDY